MVRGGMQTVSYHVAYGPHFCHHRAGDEITNQSDKSSHGDNDEDSAQHELLLDNEAACLIRLQFNKGGRTISVGEGDALHDRQALGARWHGID